MKNLDIEILVTSDSNYKKLVVEIFYKKKFFALINQDEGLDKLKIEFPDSNIEDNMVIRKIDLNIFEEGLRLSKNRIKEMYKE